MVVRSIKKDIEIIEFILDDKEIEDLMAELKNLRRNTTHIHIDIKEKKNIHLDIAKEKSLLIHHKEDQLLKKSV